MGQKQLRTARATGAVLGFVKATTPDKSEYPIPLSVFQERADTIAWLSARTRVAVPTARLHAELFGIGGAHG